MGPNETTNLQQEAKPADIDSGSPQPGRNIAPNADGENVSSIQDDAPSSLTNGHILGVPSGTMDEKAVLRDVNQPANGHLTGQQPTPLVTSPSHHTPNISNETVDGSTSPVFTPFLHPHSSARLPTRPASYRRTRSQIYNAPLNRSLLDCHSFIRQIPRSHRHHPKRETLAHPRMPLPLPAGREMGRPHCHHSAPRNIDLAPRIRPADAHSRLHIRRKRDRETSDIGV